MKNKPLCQYCNRDDATQTYPDGSYCFRCSRVLSGTQKASKPLFPILEPLEASSTEVVLPHSFTQEIPPEGLYWLYKHGITDKLIERYRIGYVKNEVVRVPGTTFTVKLKNRVILPCWHSEPFGPEFGLEWYQARALGDDQPKYITIGSEGLFGGKRGWLGMTLVITEDMLSCIRINEVGYSSIALRSTSLSDSDLLTLKDSYDTIVLWLDNDKAGINGMNKLAKRFELHGKRVIKITNQEEAKRCFNQKIRDILTKALK